MFCSHIRPKEGKACYFPRKEPSEEGLMEEVGKGGRKGTGTVLESACTVSWKCNTLHCQTFISSLGTFYVVVGIERL